jgi:hypothetical protein
MTSTTRALIVQAITGGDYARARALLAAFVTARLAHAGDDRGRFLAALEAVSDELLAVAVAVTEQAGAEGEKR